MSVILRFQDFATAFWGPFLEGLGKLLHPESHSRISKLMITEPFIHVFSAVIKEIRETPGLWSEKFSGLFEKQALGTKK